MIAGRCLLCDAPPKRGAAVCAIHARRFVPGHAGRPPERVRELRRRISEAAVVILVPRLPWWMRRHRARYGLHS